MNTTKLMTMAEAEARLVEVHGFERDAARSLLRRLHDNSRTYSKRGMSHDEPTFSIDYSLTGARYGRGRFQFLEDEPAD